MQFTCTYLEPFQVAGQVLDVLVSASSIHYKVYLIICNLQYIAGCDLAAKKFVIYTQRKRNRLA